MTTLQNLIASWKTEPVEWQKLGDGGIHTGQIAGESLLLRLNNFPDEPLFTVFGLSDAIDIEDASWRLVDGAPQSDHNAILLKRMEDALINSHEEIKWHATNSPLVFKHTINNETVYWKLNVESIHDSTLVTQHGAIDLDKAPDNWVIQK